MMQREQRNDLTKKALQAEKDASSKACDHLFKQPCTCEGDTVVLGRGLAMVYEAGNTSPTFFCKSRTEKPLALQCHKSKYRKPALQHLLPGRVCDVMAWWHDDYFASLLPCPFLYLSSACIISALLASAREDTVIVKPGRGKPNYLLKCEILENGSRPSNNILVRLLTEQNVWYSLNIN
eukprot:scaffold206219_cov17-Tisochrysis_lutea.AAC.2